MGEADRQAGPGSHGLVGRGKNSDLVPKNIAKALHGFKPGGSDVILSVFPKDPSGGRWSGRQGTRWLEGRLGVQLSRGDGEGSMH